MGDAIPPLTPKKEINLLRGWPHFSLLPVEKIKKASQKALADEKTVIPGLCYGPDPGFQPLRESIQRWTGRFFGDEGKMRDGEKIGDRICITGGASQNLACVLQVFSDPIYTNVWMVAPCYFLACRIFEDSGVVIGAVPEGDEGVDLEYLRKKLETEDAKPATRLKSQKPWSKIYRHIIYCVPTFSNPSGKTMSLTCRQSLIQLARKHDALIITDDVYDSLLWSTTPSTSNPTKAVLPRLIDVDRTLEPTPGKDSFGNAMSNGSFSKIAGPGVRTGWAEASPKFIYGLSQCGSSRSGGAPSQLTATMINELLVSGDLENHIQNTLIPAYKRRCEFMVDAITKYLSPLGVSVGETSFSSTSSSSDGVFGGYFIWIDLPSDINAEVVSLKARQQENLIVAPGKLFEVYGDESVTFPNSIRLCFSFEEEKDLAEGVERLGNAIKAVRESGAGNKGLGGEVDLALFR
ncbi:PLP-dependent transferase [Glarea lozoyensis ATCC 20868]|uniref:PLP-dependent transferase n=1 Tax=Glarea lozoyensis (strain ATCC 20868 / MF5171) TaxID=1116229 RepID=S3DGI5_GLAL2|nr:PLP-dependent transferase [Glarea lozoyensis ATCC 20868]EPE36780.1 PLP-dependent transferase [Glarea lozoyensis ATCC 20868]